jgi:N6-adenosine-specific RNA methylase IME4
MSENPNTVHGRLMEAAHISGYTFERACSELEWLLNDDRWKELGFKDGDEFVRSIEGLFAGFKVTVEQRKPLSKRLARIASQGAAAKVLGVSKSQVQRDSDPNGSKPEKKAPETAVAEAPSHPNGSKPEWFQGETGKTVTSAKRQAKKRTRQEKRDADEQRVTGLGIRPGKYRTLIIDPPWDYGKLSIAGTAAPTYATMTHEKLLKFDVLQWAESDCHLYLWTTNNFIGRAIELMAAWGFEYKTVITWVKPRLGLGTYFRNSTEHVLFGVKGNLPTRSDSIPTHFEAPLGAHSEKPDSFYELVSKASYLDAGEIFQRKQRPGFIDCFGVPADACMAGQR